MLPVSIERGFAELLEEVKHASKMQCIECGRVIDPKKEGWRKCQMCGSSICCDHTRYMRVRRQGLYGYYFDAVRVCSKCSRISIFRRKTVSSNP